MEVCRDSRSTARPISSRSGLPMALVSCSPRIDAARWISTRGGRAARIQRSCCSNPNRRNTLKTGRGDGRFLVYSSFDAKTKFDLWILSMDGKSETRPYLRTEFSEGQSQISPDGRWLPPIPRMSPAGWRSSCARSRCRTASSRSRRPAARIRGGAGMAESCSTSRPTASSWRSP